MNYARCPCDFSSFHPDRLSTHACHNLNNPSTDIAEHDPASDNDLYASSYRYAVGYPNLNHFSGGVEKKGKPDL